MAQNFITRFHDIKGESVGERQRNLNKFLKNISLTNEETQFVLDNLSPTTYLEKLFYIDVLINFKETNRLLEIFKEGNGAFVSKIIKQKWFFQEAFNNVTPKSLVNDILPSLAFSIKIKLLRNLSHVYTEEDIDEIFDYIVKRYGLFMAAPLITICSSDKIAAILKNYKIKLSTHQLKIIYKKDPNLINTYLEEQDQYNKKNVFDNNFMTYLAEKNSAYFLELIGKYQIDENLKLGRRITKKLISIKTQEIVNYPEKYIKYLRHETLVRKLNKQGHFKQLYYNLFTRKIEALQNGDALCSTLLRYYPKSDQYNLFTKTFNNVMKDDIWNYTSCMRDNILALIPNTEIRETWAKIRYKESGKEEYIKFYEIRKAINLIKEKINKTSAVKKRSKLVSLLVKSCGINKDLKNLEEVLHYFSIRHKNDNRNVRNKFLKTLENNFDLKKFTANHWKYITEIFMVQSINEEYSPYDMKFRIEHINYLFNNNGSEEDKTYFILEYIKELVQYYMTFNAFDDIKNMETQKIVLLKAAEHIDSLIKTCRRENDMYYIKCQLVAKIFWFNITYTENSINIEENKILVEHLKCILKGGQYVYFFQLYFPRIICKLNRSDFENELLNFYLKDKSLRQLSFDRALRWYLKYDPMVVVNNFESIIEELPPKSYFIWIRIKRYHHLSLDEMVIKHCMHLLEHGDNFQKYQIVESLSVLQQSEDYIKNMEDLNLIPTSSKVEVNDPEMRKVYQLQKVFLRNFKNVWNPLKYLPVVIDKFFQGDYLRESLIPLYIAFHKTPENKLDIHLNKLTNNQAMSVKKHGLYLACYVFNQEKVWQIFNSFQEDKNESLQKCICLSSLRYFTKVQTQEYFEKVHSYLKFLKEYDMESLEILSSAQIPKQYKSYYIIHIWNLFKQLKTSSNAVGFNKLMSTVLGNIDKNCLSNLPEDFCKSIINNYFDTCVKKEEICNIFKFTIQFLMYHKNQNDNLNHVFQLVSNYKSQFWDSKDNERSVVHKFFKAFFTTVYEDDRDLEFVTKFSKEWEKIFTPNDTFKEYVLLNLLRFKKDVKDNTKLYSKHIVLFAEEVSSKYGEFVFSKLPPIIYDFCISGKKDTEVIELLTTMLKYTSLNNINCILVMELISIKGDLFYKNKIRPMYHGIDLMLKEISNSKVQLCYNLYSNY